MMIRSVAEAASWGLAAACGLLTLVWIGSLIRKDASLVDRFWGLGFVVLVWLYYLTAPEPSERRVAWPVVAMVTVWGLRLAFHLTWRNWGHGEDYRYRTMRERQGPSFAVTNLVTVHLLQAVIMWFVSLPVLLAIRAGVEVGEPLVWAGGGLWAIGLFFETVGDWQLTRFKADPANRGRVLDTGLWRYTRHPNYFGDACVWWGLYLLAGAVGGWWTIMSPLLMTGLLLKVSGVALLEKQLAATKPQYRDYIERTSPFFPRPPRPAR